MNEILLAAPESSSLWLKFCAETGVVTERTERRPRLALLGGRIGWEMAGDLLRQRVPVVLQGAQNTDLEEISFLVRTAKRNHVPLGLLGSFRWLPVIAAVKEILETGVLGNVFCQIQVPAGTGPLDCCRARDLAYWLSGRAEWTLSADRQFHFLICGGNGKLQGCSDPDGNHPYCQLTLMGRTHVRYVPTASPELVELGVLKQLIPPEGKVRDLSLLWNDSTLFDGEMVP